MTKWPSLTLGCPYNFGIDEHLFLGEHYLELLKHSREDVNQDFQLLHL